MRLGEVCLLTNNVVRLADFYRALLNIDDGCDDRVHQTILSKETMLTVYNDGSEKNNRNRNICLAFSCDDIYSEYDKLKKRGVKIIEEPTERPWGSVNLSFYDPDGNIIYLRSLKE